MLIRRATLIALALYALAPSAPARADAPASTWSCAAETFASPSVIQDCVYKATLVTDCEIVGATGGGLPSLHDYLVTHATDAETVHSGPTPTTYKDMPAVSFDVTVKDKGSDARMRQDVFIATDSKDQLAYATISKDVQNAGPLKKIDAMLDVTAASAGQYKVRLSSTIHVKKPVCVIPNGSFKGPADKQARQNFVKNRDKVLPMVAGQL